MRLIPFSNRRALMGLLIAGLTQVHGQALAQADGEKKADGYEGVTPGLNRKNPLPPPKESSPRLVWTGFQKAEEGSRVFLQTTSPVTFDVNEGKGGKELSVFLRDCRIHLENNQRKLDTRFFDTPVASVRARQVRKDVQITITLKQPSPSTPRTEEGPDGSQFLVLEFPPVQQPQGSQ